MFASGPKTKLQINDSATFSYQVYHIILKQFYGSLTPLKRTASETQKWKVCMSQCMYHSLECEVMFQYCESETINDSYKYQKPKNRAQT